MARRVVDNQEDLTATVFCNQTFEKRPEGLPIEYVSKPVGKLGIVQLDGGEQVCRLALTVRIHTGLATNACPRSMQRTIKPEARFILEEDYTATRRGFFLILGNFSRSQYSWRS